ncbi:MAG: sporulation protein YqfD [Lachnospiraceae bacterium]|nr:sporulation protein YqfD [Lachnospiraceae bacterium]
MQQVVCGYYKIQFEAECTERFLNMCHHHRLDLWAFHCEKKSGSLCVSRRDLGKIRELMEKAQMHVTDETAHGLPHALRRVCTYKLILPGLFLCLLILFALSRIVWSIHIVGNSQTSTQSILTFLEQEMTITHGMAKSGIQCDKIASGIRFHFPQVIWVSAKVKGTQLLIELQENQLQAEEEETAEPPSMDICASRDGVVTDIFVRSGTPEVTVGQACQKGDVLISGSVPIYNDGQEVVRTKQVVPDGDVYLKTSYSYYESFPLQYQKQVYTGVKKDAFFIQIGPYRFESAHSKGKKETLNQSVITSQLRITEYFLLPVYWGNIQREYYEIQHLRYTDEDAKEKTYGNLIAFLEKLMEKGVQICENNVRIELHDDQCIASGKIQVIEKAGTKSS